ncbi:MAG: methyltransferase domain-containing protein [Methanomassiliicoccales archaeon]|nr:methyltransferase domain-containing protein [Methanomassiliicoccales archaeon]
MRDDRDALERQLHRQLLWLRDSWIWLLKSKVVPDRGLDSPRLSALDIGCGPGLVMQLLEPFFEVTGVDIDAGSISSARSSGLDVALANANDLPYDDNSFDLVYCSFLILWLEDPVKAIGEMKRVARKSVICLAEPDYGGRIDFPAELADLTRFLAIEIRDLGGDPYVGRKLRSFFNQNGMVTDIGIHQGVWDLETIRRQSEEEWAGVERAAERHVDAAFLRQERATWDRSLESGDLFQFNPVFYAIGRKD